MDDVLRELIETIKTLSPAVWEIYRRQADVIMYQRLVWVIGLVALLWGAVVGTQKTLKARAEESPLMQDTYDMPIVLEVVCILLISMILVALTASLISNILNPDYVAIQLLLETIK